MNQYEVHFTDGSSIVIPAKNEREAYQKASKFAVELDIEEVELIMDMESPIREI